MDVKEIGTRLKQLRTDANVTQEALAEMMGVSVMTIRRVENGEGLHIRNILAFSESLGLTLGEVFDMDQGWMESDHIRLRALVKRVEAASDETIALSCDLLEVALSRS